MTERVECSTHPGNKRYTAVNGSEMWAVALRLEQTASLHGHHPESEGKKS